MLQRSTSCFEVHTKGFSQHVDSGIIIPRKGVSEYDVQNLLLALTACSTERNWRMVQVKTPQLVATYGRKRNTHDECCSICVDNVLA